MTPAKRAVLFGGRQWTPAQLENKWAWWRRGIGITGAVNVSNWADQFELGRPLIQATGAWQPTLQADGSILWDGISQFMSTGAKTFNAPRSVVFFMKVVTWVGDRYVCDGFTGFANLCYFPAASGSPNLGIYAGTELKPNANLAVGTWGMVACTWGTNGLLQVNNTTPLTGNTGTAAAGGLTVGAISNGSNNWSNIQVREIVVTSAALTAAEIAKLYAYGQRTGLVA